MNNFDGYMKEVARVKRFIKRADVAKLDEFADDFKREKLEIIEKMNIDEEYKAILNQISSLDAIFEKELVNRIEEAESDYL